MVSNLSLKKDIFCRIGTNGVSLKPLNCENSTHFLTSREWDAESSTYHYRPRQYSPYVGRFNRRDDIEYDGGLNLYSYVGDNPVNYADPSGYKKIDLTYISGDIDCLNSAFAGWPPQVKSNEDLQNQIKTSIPEPIDKTGEHGNCLRNLKVIGHGTEKKIEKAEDRALVLRSRKGATGEALAPFLLEGLVGIFCDDGKIILAGCFVGVGQQGTDYMKGFAEKFQVRVEAPMGAYNTLTGPLLWKWVKPANKDSK